jgi:hypothetical protein
MSESATGAPDVVVFAIVTTDVVIPPEGGKIEILSVQANDSRSWEDAVSAAGPNTGRDWDIWRVGDFYPPMAGATEGLQEIILVNFGGGGYMRSEEILAWAKSQRLIPGSPRKVFAVGESCPSLHWDLGTDVMSLVSLVPCSFEGRRRVPSVWWYGSLRQADLRWFAYGWYAYNWFAFIRG